MYNYSIMGLFRDHVPEVTRDILAQYRDGVADMALFNMTLVPEGTPPEDKAASLCETYDLYRDALAAHGAQCGILVQASIGHGYPLDAPFPFQKAVNLTDGEEVNVVCPYDEDFRTFFRGQMKTLAAHKPALIMLDDDFRLLGRGGMGCACPLHMAAFNELAGTHLTREELFARLREDTAEARQLAEIFLAVQKESLVGAAKAFRAGIDEVDPTIPGVYCCVAGEFEYEIAHEMAGEGHPVIVRVNNGNYTPAGARYLTDAILRAAYQIHTAAGKVDAFLAETDTCPQNRYSTGAHSLHAHFTGTILEGASGAKHWITRLSSHEPKSGRAYREMLGAHTGFYRALAAMVPTLRPLGCRIPLPKKWSYDFNGDPFTRIPRGFSGCVLERLGLPLYFSGEAGGAVFMDGCADKNFSDEEMQEMLAHPVFLDGQTAAHLIGRGFGEDLGVEVRQWQGKPLSGEILPNGNCVSKPVRAMELVPVDSAVRADSWIYHNRSREVKEKLFPGVTVFDNSQGGRVTVFAGDPQTQFNYIEAFSFLNESRKEQLVELLHACGCLPIYAASDAEIYLRAAAMPDGGLFAAVFNLSLDGLDEIELVSESEITYAERLLPDGTREACPVVRQGVTANGMYAFTVQSPAPTLDPAVLFLYESTPAR